jgi:hypothetical protein
VRSECWRTTRWEEYHFWTERGEMVYGRYEVLSEQLNYIKKRLSCDKNSAFYFFGDLLYYGDLLWIIIAGTYRLYNRL